MADPKKPAFDRTKAPPLVFKILSLAEWRKAGAFVPCSDDDRRDGYMHLSGPDEIVATVRKHFAGKTGLVALAIDAEKIEAPLRYEASRDGALFPHCYGEIGRSAVVAIREIVSSNGDIRFGVEQPL